MARMIAFLLGFATLAWVGYRYVYTQPPAPREQSAPKQALDNVQQKADALEQELQERADQAGQE